MRCCEAISHFSSSVCLSVKSVDLFFLALQREKMVSAQKLDREDGLRGKTLIQKESELITDSFRKSFEVIKITAEGFVLHQQYEDMMVR